MRYSVQAVAVLVAPLASLSSAFLSMSEWVGLCLKGLHGPCLCLKGAYQSQVGHGVRLESLSENSITMPIDPSASYTNVSFSLFPISTPRTDFPDPTM